MIRLNLKHLAETKKGWTLYKLAAEMNTHRQVIYRWERGFHLPGAKTLEALCDVLGCNISELLIRE